MGGTWVIADPHFDHANILNFKRRDGTPLRPFKSVEEMNNVLIANWNSVVGEGDRVYLLGDVAFDHRVFHRIIPQLTGRIVLVPGNHDPVKMRKYFDVFDDVRGYVC
jgi:calcineurin-like phosphoesterase family protein